MGTGDPFEGDVGWWRDVLGGGRASDGALDDEEVRHAIATGDPLRVHRTLCRPEPPAPPKGDVTGILSCRIAARRAPSTRMAWNGAPAARPAQVERRAV